MTKAEWCGVVMGVVLVLLGKGLPETEDLRRNWLGREVAGQGIPGRGIRMCSLLCVEGLDVFLGVRKLGGGGKGMGRV